jgi:hypothetical protein
VTSVRTNSQRRPARTGQDLGQTAIVMVVAMSVLLMTIGAILVQQTLGSAPLLQTDNLQHYAYRALQAGMNSYQSVVNSNPNLANCNTSTNTKPLCNGSQYEHWFVVSGTDQGNGVIPEYFLFGNPQPVINANGSLASLQVQVVGTAGYPGHWVYQSSVASLTPNNDYLNDVWWSDYEASDSKDTNPNYQGGNICKYNYDNGYNGPGGNCHAVSFSSADTINGPVYSNDSIYISGTPTFGTSPTFSPVTTGDPNCVFVASDGTQCPSNDVYDGDGANVAQIPSSSINHKPETNASDVSALAQVAGEAAPNNGCIYYGPTTITLTGSTMTVVSPDTVNPSANCPATGTSGNLPPNGVLYVENAVAAGQPNSKVVTGANPYDDTAHNGAYAQTSGCGPYTITVAGNTNTMPCYFGYTGSAKQDSEGDAFIQGNLAATSTIPGELTVASDNDIIITGNLTYSDCTGHWASGASTSACAYQTNGLNDVLGLIATNYVDVNHPVDPASTSTLLPTCGSTKDPVTGKTVSPAFSLPLCQSYDSNQNITIDATILALTQSFWVNNFESGGLLGNIILYGSLQQEARGTVSIIGTTGFNKDYTWDPRLQLVSPPSYLTPGIPSYLLASSAITSPSTGCPKLQAVYNGNPNLAGTVNCPQVP